MSDIGDAIGNVFDSILGGGDEQPKQPSISMPEIDLSAIEKSNTLLTEQIAEMTRRNETLATESQARMDSFTKQADEVKKPLSMPSPTSSDVRVARRKAAASLSQRGGRGSTLLSDPDALGG